jgi:CheY-like chemotaxis protein
MSGKRVLVVDDHPVNRLLVSVMLREAGHEVGEAENGRQALDKLHDQPWDIVLLDISMPDMSGDEVCRHIRADDALKGLRVIAYTAHAMNGERDQILASGYDGLLTKPISRASLHAALGLTEQ